MTTAYMNNVNWAQSNMNCGLTKWFVLLHDVKVRCGIERHDWALGSLHVPACQACDCCHFRPRNVVEGGDRTHVAARAHRGTGLFGRGHGCSIATNRFEENLQ
jgi:hypothetical protein